MAVHEFPGRGAGEGRRPPALCARRAALADFALRAAAPDPIERLALDFDALVRPRMLLEAVSEMAPGESARIEFLRTPLGWRLELAWSRMRDDESGFRALLGAVAPRARFGETALAQPRLCTQVARLAPRPTAVAGEDGKPIWLPPTGCADSHLTRALALAFAFDVEALTFELRPLPADPARHAALTAAAYRLAEKGGADAPAHELIAGWLAAEQGCSIEVEASSSRELGEGELDALALALFGASRGGPAPGLDLRLALPRGTLTTWRFWPVAADVRRYPASKGEIAAGGGALTLGVDSGGRPIRIAAADRPRHVFVCGATGSGKTTLIENAVCEDIENGEGVLLIDPHGDCAHRVRARVPERRRGDVVWIDLGSPDLAWRLDLFHTPGIFVDAERDRIANQLIAFFRQLWSGTPEAFGPAFESYFRAVILLLHSAKDPANRSLLKVRRVLTDSDFRHELLSECDDEEVKATWAEMADVDGDWKIANMSPYITVKLSILVGPLTRRFIGGDKPRLDLRAAMDSRKIVIVNLNKGVINDYGARFCGALVLMALIEAAMGRCNVPEAERVPLRVYCDEFQTMASDLAATALAECRKFNLSLLLANQSLSQLRGSCYAPTDVSQSVLNNCGTLVVFRTGKQDAQILATALSLDDERELLRLGVGEAFVRRLVHGFPAPAQLMFGLPPPPV